LFPSYSYWCVYVYKMLRGKKTRRKSEYLKNMKSLRSQWKERVEGLFILWNELRYLLCVVVAWFSFTSLIDMNESQFRNLHLFVCSPLSLPLWIFSSSSLCVSLFWWWLLWFSFSFSFSSFLNIIFVLPFTSCMHACIF